jgi:hypothetical protein
LFLAFIYCRRKSLISHNRLVRWVDDLEQDMVFAVLCKGCKNLDTLPNIKNPD